MYKSHLTAAAVLLGAATGALADQVFNDDVIVDGNLCTGSSCADMETFGGFETLKLSATGVGLLFNDTGGTSDNDWRLQANATGEDSFFLTDVTGGTSPFKVMGAAPSNSLFVAADGDVGLGTTMPMTQLHIVDDAFEVAIRLESTNARPSTWFMSGAENRFTIFEPGRVPFQIYSGAPGGAFTIAANGDIGIGDSSPEGKLHTKGNGVQLAYFESGDGDAVQVRFRTDSENRRFLAVDNANNVKTQMQFRDNSIKFLGQTVADEWLSVSAAGITTAGPTCNPGPCDATFDPEAFTVPPIAERAAFMWENQYLWGVGPTKPNEPINLTQKMGGVIHELEVAHIYIEQLHARLETQEAAHARQMQDILRRLEAIESN